MLPTEKNTPGQNPLGKKFLVYGEPKVGKSTLASTLFPDAIFFATDPTGLEELPVFKVDVGSWDEFREAGKELAVYLTKHKDPIYGAIVVDTVDELSRLCNEHVLTDLPGGPVGKGFKHVSDWDYGKGYDAITEEFRLRVAKLCALGLPVVFISHAKSRIEKNRRGLEITRYSPDIGKGQLKDWLQKFVDYIFFAQVMQTDKGEARLLRTMPSETYLAGGRQPEGKPMLPDPLQLNGKALRAALEATASGGNHDGMMTEEEAREALKMPDVEPQASPRKPVRKAKPKPAKPKAAA